MNFPAHPHHPPEHARLFYALWPDDATRAALMSLQAGVQGRKVPAENLHVTLAFLGEQPSRLLPALIDVLQRLPQPDMVLKIDRLGYFRRNRIAWAGMSEVPAELTGLHQSLSELLRDTGMDIRSDSRFRPHVTLARDAPEAPDDTIVAVEWKVKSAVLVRSMTAPGGSVYSVLAG